jgi:hypothetical protein
MTVYLRGVPEPRGPGGLRYRIAGPVANEDPAEARGKELERTIHATALAFAVAAATVLVRGFLVLPKSVVHYVVLVVACWNGLAFLANYLVLRPQLRDRFRLAAMIITCVLVAELMVETPRTAVWTALPASLFLAWRVAHRIATQHALWMTENLHASWEERERYRSEWEELPRPFLVALAAAVGCMVVFHIAERDHPQAGAGWTTILALIIALAAPLLLRANPLAASAAACRAFVFWFNYNLHGWYGPQTYQFEDGCRSPVARKAWVFVAVAALAAAVSCLTSVLPGPHLGLGDRPEASRTMTGGIPTAADPEPVVISARTLDPTQKLFHDQLPAGERELYLRELRKGAPRPGALGSATRYASDVLQEPISLAVALLASLAWAPVAPALFALILVASYGPTLARFDAALEAPHRNRE